ncbi:uncharacterized protein (UPF0276 family) [Streptomyces albogriseolus]
MKRDIAAVHEALAELLTDVQRRRAWLADPQSYAKRRLEGSAEAAVIGGLDPEGLCAAALHLDMRRVSQGPEPVDAGPVTQSVTRAWRGAAKPLCGLGFWPDLYARFEGEAEVQVWEHRIDDYLRDGRARRMLDALADRSSVVMHSVGLSVGSPQATADPDQLKRMRRLLAVAGAPDLSDHLAFSRTSGCSLGHFVPQWRVEESLELTAANVRRIQDALGVQLALENIALTFDPGGELTTAEFLTELVARTGCGILLDLTNLTLNGANGFCDVTAELARLRLDAVTAVHLAGGDEAEGRHYDAHAFPVDERDLSLLSTLVSRMPNCRAVVIERDGRRGEISEVRDDLRRTQAALRSPAGP